MYTNLVYLVDKFVLTPQKGVKLILFVSANAATTC
jgi:hypothetical protein